MKRVQLAYSNKYLFLIGEENVKSIENKITKISKKYMYKFFFHLN